MRLATWADDGDGLVRVPLGDALQGPCRPGQDLVPRLAVCDLLVEIAVDDPGAEHVGGSPSDGWITAALVSPDADLDKVRHGLDLDAGCGGEGRAV